MNIKDKILNIIYGSNYMEFYYADSFLEAFNDGIPRDNLPKPDASITWTSSRVIKYLIENGYLEPFGQNGYIITTLGQMHLSKGGDRGEFLRHKLSRLSFALSIIATVISIISFFIAINR